MYTETDDELINNEIIWSDDDEVNMLKGGAKNIVQLSMNSNINLPSITPRLAITEDVMAIKRLYTN